MQVGQGEFGTVHYGCWLGAIVAIKVLKGSTAVAVGDFRCAVTLAPASQASLQRRVQGMPKSSMEFTHTSCDHPVELSLATVCSPV